jgi:hypothetical protein
VPRYYFHFRDGQLIRDEFGQVLADNEAALRLARGIAAQLAEGGKHPTAAILVSDGVRTVFEMALSDLVPVAAARQK